MGRFRPWRSAAMAGSAWDPDAMKMIGGIDTRLLSVQRVCAAAPGRAEGVFFQQHSLLHVVPLLVHSHQNHRVLAIRLAAIIEPEPGASRLAQELVQLGAVEHAALVLAVAMSPGLGRGLVERNAVTLRIGKRHETLSGEGRNRLLFATRYSLVRQVVLLDRQRADPLSGRLENRV